MATHRPIDLTTHAAPPFRPHTPDPDHEAQTRRTYLTKAENALKEILFGNAKIKPRAIEQYVHAQHNHQRTPPESPTPPSKSAGDISPSNEAASMVATEQNGFGDEYGWPGLGTWKGYSHSTTTPQPMKKRDQKLESVMREAIDEAAGQSYGWPGLGSWSNETRN